MDLGKRIKERRTYLCLTQEELANRCELTKGYISQLENDKVSPSIETLELILEVLGISLSDFFKNEQTSPIVFSKDEQYEKEFDGYLQTWLVPTSQKHMMEPILVVLEPHQTTFKDYPHNGEEFGYVMDGEIIVSYGELKKKVSKGEAFYFETTCEHYIENRSQKVAKVLCFSCPPNF